MFLMSKVPLYGPTRVKHQPLTRKIYSLITEIHSPQSPKGSLHSSRGRTAPSAPPPDKLQSRKLRLVSEPWLRCIIHAPSSSKKGGWGYRISPALRGGGGGSSASTRTRRQESKANP